MNLIDPKIIDIKVKKLIGMRLEMSLVDNKTADLFRAFMPRKKEINNTVSNGVIALQKYDLMTFTPQTVFEKWACVEVTDFDVIPNNMETLAIEAGKYAIFIHKGTTENFVQLIKYILYTWLPNSPYRLDNRPHFEYLTSTYLGPNNPDSEEEVWVPIQ